MKLCHVAILLGIWSGNSFGTFILNFQSKDKLSTEEWAEYLGNVPAMKEITTCWWEKVNHFARDFTQVWQYCKQRSESDQRIKCSQNYHRGTSSTLNRHINFYAWIDGKTEINLPRLG